MPDSSQSRPVLGWREWVSLPDLGIGQIKAKVDTGARTSALHAYEIEEYTRGGQLHVRFKVHPSQKSAKETVTARALVLDRRHVKSSAGHLTFRYVIETDIVIDGAKWPIELTLVNRDEMGFRMLLGRQAVRRRWLVDPSHSFLASKRQTKILAKKKKSKITKKKKT